MATPLRMSTPVTQQWFDDRINSLETRLAELEEAVSRLKSGSKITTLIAIIDYIRRDELPEDRKVLLSLKKDEVRELSAAELEELVRPSRRACSAYDVLGILLKEVDPEIRHVMCENWGDSIAACWNAAKRSGLVELDRKGRPDRWKNFEELANHVTSRSPA